VLEKEHGTQKTERLRVIDWETPIENDFLLVSQFSVTGTLYTCRPDLVGFVNGFLPMTATARDRISRRNRTAVFAAEFVIQQLFSVQQTGCGQRYYF